MKALILAAGYGTRMSQTSVGTPEEKLIASLPKPLLPIKGKPVVFHIYNQLKQSSNIKQIILVTNNKYLNKFIDWRNQSALDIEIISDNSTENNNRLGAIKSIKYAIDHQKINDDLLIIAGDTLLDYKVRDFIEFFKKKNAPVITLHQADNLGQISRRNEVILDENFRITSFIEKPVMPKSLLYSPPCYLYQPNISLLIDSYLSSGGNPDAPGMLIEWLHKQIPVYGYNRIKRRFDIGDYQSYMKTAKNY